MGSLISMGLRTGFADVRFCVRKFWPGTGLNWTSAAVLRLQVRNVYTPRDMTMVADSRWEGTLILYALARVRSIT